MVDGDAGAEDVVEAAVAVAAGAADSLLPSLFVSVLLSLLDSVFGFDDEYASAYQPPPLRMKLPPLMSRCASAWWHSGHSVRGASEIFWISSHW